MKMLFNKVSINGLWKAILFISMLSPVLTKAQNCDVTSKINELIHTRLDIKLDYHKCYLYGKEWVTLRPYAYPTDSVRLDAKGMNILKVALVNGKKLIPLHYQYVDSVALAVQLDKAYLPAENYTLYIDYIAKPNQLKEHGSAAITDAKGLYFINPDSAVKAKPVQVWTQGETQAASAWFPTIDQPNQKCTSEINLTVPSKYVSLSNGQLTKQQKNKDGTRTDSWRMRQRNAPYLFMLAVGNFKIYHDHWRNRPVDYYLEPAYAPYAKAIFGRTPEMLDYFSKTLGVDFPWNKYAQIVVRDYVSGAMENTTATLHGEYVQETPKQLTDNGYDAGQSTIAHELFHQWFGDYVTCKSWGNLTVNESFADFSESLWADHYYGQDEGDAHRFAAMKAYLADTANYSKTLVRYHYQAPEDMFDAVTYAKGGRILDMLRNYLGDAVFFKGLQNYLKANAFGNAEADQLRLAMEASSGKDLNWFFNEWYYGAGHPVLDISYAYEKGVESVMVKQLQRTKFQFPVAIDIYTSEKKIRHQVWITSRTDTIRFKVSNPPDLVIFDGDKKLLCQKNDHHTLKEYEYQYAHAPHYLDRLEALDTAITHQDNTTILAALDDPYFGIRLDALHAAAIPEALAKIKTMTINDQNMQVRAAALNALAAKRDKQYFPFFQASIGTPSYAVQAAALNGILPLDMRTGFSLAKRFEKDHQGALTESIILAYLMAGNEQQWEFIVNNFVTVNPQSQYNFLGLLGGMTARLESIQAVSAIYMIRDFALRFKSSGIVPSIIGMLNQIHDTREAVNNALQSTIKTLKDINK